MSDYLDVSVPAAISQDAIGGGAGPERHDTPDGDHRDRQGTHRVGDRVGSVTFTQDGKLIAGMPLVATREVRRPNPFQRVYIGAVRVWRSLFGALAPG